MTMQIFVKALSGRTLTLDVVPRQCIADVKRQVEAQDGTPAAHLRLVFGTEPLDDGQTLAHYNVQSESTMHSVLRLRGGSSGAGGAGIRAGAVAGRKKKPPALNILDSAMDVFVQVRIGDEKQRTSLCVNGGSNCSWRPDPEADPKENAKIKNRLVFNKPGLLLSNPTFTIEAYEVDGLDSDLVGRDTLTLADTFREDDGDRTIHKRLAIEYDGLFAGSIELIVDQRSDDEVHFEILGTLELRNPDSTDKLRGYIDWQCMGIASVLLFLYYLIGCLFFALYPYALAGDEDVCCADVAAGNLNGTLQQGGCPGGAGSFADAFYWSTCTITTIGYGDMTLSDPGARLFTVFFAVFGLFVVSIFLGIFSDTVTACSERTAVEKERSGRPDTKCEEFFGTYAGQAVQGLLSVAAMLFVNALLIAADSGFTLTFLDSLYYGIITASSIGYGDFSPSSPESKIFAAVWFFVMIFAFAAALGSFAGVILTMREDKKARQVQEQFGAKLSASELDGIISDGAGPGATSVTKAQFVVSMLKKLEVCDDDDVTGIIKQFKKLDKTGDGRLNADDITDTTSGEILGDAVIGEGTSSVAQAPPAPPGPEEVKGPESKGLSAKGPPEGKQS